MATNDRPRDGQAAADTRKFALRMQALEGLEEPFGVFAIETNAVVLDEENGFLAAALAAKSDPRRRSFGRKLPGVLKEFFHGSREQAPVAIDDQIRFDGDSDLTVGLTLPETSHE